MKRVLISTMFFLWLGLVQVVAQEGQIDWNRAQQIHQKFLRGDKLTDEEQAYHDRAAKALRANSGQKSDDGIDWAKAERLHQKFVRGEKLTEEERAYHDRAAKVIQSRSKSQSPPGPVIKPPAGLRRFRTCPLRIGTRARMAACTAVERTSRPRSTFRRRWCRRS